MGRRWVGAAESMREDPACCAVPGEKCNALPVSPMCTHPHKTQIHRSGACNDRTTTSEQHRRDGHKHEETTQSGRGNRTQYPEHENGEFCCGWGLKYHKTWRKRARETLVNVPCWRQKGNIRQENQSNDTASWTAWHDLLKDRNYEVVRTWPDSLLSLTSLRCSHLHRKKAP